MKKILATVLSFALLLVFSLTAFADGNPNIDGGGGETEDGTSTSFWNTGDDGVRVTIVRETDKRAMVDSIDFSNKRAEETLFHFNFKNKLVYKNGSSLGIMKNGYKNSTPTTPLPTVVSASGGVNIQSLKNYFADEGNLRGMCSQIGLNFDVLIDGKYVILLEPLVYITYNGIRFCMTATEAALYDRMTDGDLKSKLGNITHQNLPLAMFLETPDLGFPARCKKFSTTP